MSAAQFADILKESRRTAGLSQQQVADATGLGRVYIAQLESGSRDNPGWDVIVRLAECLGAGFADAVSASLSATYLTPKKTAKKSV